MPVSKYKHIMTLSTVYAIGLGAVNRIPLKESKGADTSLL